MKIVHKIDNTWTRQNANKQDGDIADNEEVFLDQSFAKENDSKEAP